MNTLVSLHFVGGVGMSASDASQGAGERVTVQAHGVILCPVLFPEASPSGPVVLQRRSGS